MRVSAAGGGQPPSFQNEHPRPGLVYSGVPDFVVTATSTTPRLTDVELPYLGGDGSRLEGAFVRVGSAGMARHPDGTLQPIPPARPNEAGRYEYRARYGGASAWRNEAKGGAVAAKIIEASQFGQVNTYYHTTRIAAYLHQVLTGSGLPALPEVSVQVGAHSGYSTDGRLDVSRILAGGHYRVAASEYDPAEATPIAVTGEIHLGAGRYAVKWGLPHHGTERTRTWAGRSYFHQASHNAAIIYHEYGHHLVRHTADFRCNRQRPAHQQSNVKSWLDEGTCDYFTAVLLDTPLIFEWHRGNLPPHHPRYRNLLPGRRLPHFDRRPSADPHFNGTIWATLLWRLRLRLLESGWTGLAIDQAIVQTLFRLGEAGMPNPQGDATLRIANIHHRNRLDTALTLLSDELAQRGYQQPIRNLL